MMVCITDHWRVSTDFPGKEIILIEQVVDMVHICSQICASLLYNSLMTLNRTTLTCTVRSLDQWRNALCYLIMCTWLMLDKECKGLKKFASNSMKLVVLVLQIQVLECFVIWVQQKIPCVAENVSNDLRHTPQQKTPRHTWNTSIWYHLTSL